MILLNFLNLTYAIAGTLVLFGLRSAIEIKKSGKIELDSKTKLQEYSLKRFRQLPTYKVLAYKGPQHNPLYKVSVKIYESKFFYGVGNSKKIAEHNAAKKLIRVLKIK